MQGFDPFSVSFYNSFCQVIFTGSHVFGAKFAARKNSKTFEPVLPERFYVHSCEETQSRRVVCAGQMQFHFTFRRLFVKSGYMIKRPFWIEKIEKAWLKAPIVWLTGVRRVGKTTLASEIADAYYLNCDLPSSQEQLQDIERFFKTVPTKRVILDEVHQLPEPSRILKIGADCFPELKILATGSSTLAATQKFRDSLTGRKRVVHLLPVLIDELSAFGVHDVKDRLLRGGLPQNLLSPLDHEVFSEWLDSFYARDIQELFRIEKRSGFLKLLELILHQSGGMLEVTKLSKQVELSRPTVMNYLEVLQVTHAAFVLPPFSGGGRREIIGQAKLYGFDTGFIAYARAWTELRSDDVGSLWEHLVLETLRTTTEEKKIHYWRDKQHREVDFVVESRRASVDAIESKWSANAFDPRGMKAFREIYPTGRNFVISSQSGPPYSRQVGELDLTFANLADLPGLLQHIGS